MTTPIIGRGEKPKTSAGATVALALIGMLIAAVAFIGTVIALAGWLISAGAGIPFWNGVALAAALILCVFLGSALVRRK